MYKIFKRFFDIMSALILLVIISPLLFFICLILRFSDEGEVFFLQQRIGKNNSSFKIFKFATMLKNSSKMKNGYITIKNDPRVTKFGSFLRKSKINELPQLLNIILGDMSVVGPRPVMRVSFEAYPKLIQKNIYNSKPGLTGIGSIVFRDEEELISKAKSNGINVLQFYKETIYPLKGDLEIWYQRNQSFIIDFKIIICTIIVILYPNWKKYNLLFKSLPSLGGLSK